jgi:hypothetical protein
MAQPLKKEKKFIRGFFDATKFGYRMKIHKDAIAAASKGEWKPVGDFFQIEVLAKRDGGGYYMAEDNWAPDPNYKKATTTSSTKIDDGGDLPF